MTGSVSPSGQADKLMHPFHEPIIETLAANGRANAERMTDDGATHDFFPVVKLFMPDDAGKSLHMDNDGNIVGIVGEMDLPQPELDIRDAAGWADARTLYDRNMAAGEYDLAAEYAHEWLMITGDAAFWSPLIRGCQPRTARVPPAGRPRPDA